MGNYPYPRYCNTVQANRILYVHSRYFSRPAPSSISRGECPVYEAGAHNNLGLFVLLVSSLARDPCRRGCPVFACPISNVWQPSSQKTVDSVMSRQLCLPIPGLDSNGRAMR
ncbi:hypothetical protein RRG08_004769 [Elysia crispata]|uniref:Uncharacterized protein n=1 Tax=Elysia crispata TaxID=231223 RepID=A0AAE1DZ98_9GAST|nr:hypothetical protein RRG08_004769 [Elysia crispata]